MLKKLWITLPLTLLCAAVQAQTNKISVASSTPANTLAAPAAATSSTTPAKEESAPVKFFMAMSLAYETQAQTQPNGTRSESIAYIFIPGMTFSDYKLSALALYSQDLKNSAKTGSFIDPSFTFSRNAIDLGQYFKLGPSLSLTVPMSDYSKNIVELQYSVGGALYLGLNTKNLGMDKWSIGYNLFYTRNLTKYSTDANGELITLQRIRNRMSVGYRLTDNLSLSTRFELDSNYSAEGVVRNKFAHSQSLSYKINNTVSVNGGHSNSDALLDGTTYQSNLNFYDEVASKYTLGLDISI